MNSNQSTTTRCFTIVNAKTGVVLPDPYNSARPLFEKECTYGEAVKHAMRASVMFGFQCEAMVLGASLRR